MSLDETKTTLSDLVSLLARCDLAVPAQWFSERLSRLERANASEVRVVLDEVHKAIPGMGGLTDIWLNPPTSSGLIKETANELKYQLQERLYQLTATN